MNFNFNSIRYFNIAKGAAGSVDAHGTVLWNWKIVASSGYAKWMLTHLITSGEGSRLCTQRAGFSHISTFNSEIINPIIKLL